jgi:hypothetical protein
MRACSTNRDVDKTEMPAIPMKTCLNVGCGLTVHPGWLNIDASPSLRIRHLPLVGDMLARAKRIPDWPADVRYGNIVDGLSLPAGSCELVFVSHVLEHLSLADLDHALVNILRYLQPGARLRILMPDLELYARAYLGDRDGRDPEIAAMAAPAFMKRSGIGAAGSRQGVLRRVREALSNSRHQWLWDVPSMTAKLGAYGFADVRRRSFRESDDARFFLIEDESRHHMSFCLECVRP